MDAGKLNAAILEAESAIRACRCIERTSQAYADTAQHVLDTAVELIDLLQAEANDLWNAALRWRDCLEAEVAGARPPRSGLREV